MDNPDASPIGVNQVQWYGCMTVTEAEYDVCDTIDTVLSTDSSKYRHYAVDTTSEPIEKKIIYFCDLNQYRPGMFCYCSDRKSGEANTWSELPRYIGGIK